MMSGDKIHQSLRSQNLTYSDLARLLGVTVQHISGVCHRKTYSARVAKAIAVAIGKPLVEVFPDVPQYFNKVRQIDPKARAAGIEKVRKSLAQAGVSVRPRAATHAR